MKYTFAGWILELAIPLVLLWKHYDLYDLGWYDLEVMGWLLVVTPFFLTIHLMQIKKKHLLKNVRLKLLFLTGPTLFLCMSLVLGLTYELRKVAIFGGVPKEIVAEVNRNKEKTLLEKGDNYETRFLSKKLSRLDVVGFLGIERIKSEILIYAMLLASTCILYGHRYSLGKIEYSKGRLEDSEEPQKEQG